MKIRKAVFPVAGLGTRFLPATKANPKEMLPIVDKPLIQYAVEEAISAGITEIIFVTSSSKRAIEDHFDSHYELEHKLAEQGKNELLTLVKDILPKGISCSYVRQPDALGLGHAVLCAKPLVGEEPFAVLLADDLISNEGDSCLEQMMKLYNEQQHSIVAVQNIERIDTNKYGIIECDATFKKLGQINGIVEKPLPELAPSTLAVVGRYILTPRVFDLLEKTTTGAGGEIQLTDALSDLLEFEVLSALQFQGTRYDCGSKLGYLQATVAYALKRSDIAEDFKSFLEVVVNSDVCVN